MFNATISGRIGKDAEQKRTPNGTPYVEFTVAVNTSFNKEDQPEWVRVVFWQEKRMDFMLNNCKKGALVVVVGQLKINRWQKDGRDNAMVELNAQEIIAMGGVEVGRGSQPAPQSSAQTEEEDDGDLPF